MIAVRVANGSTVFAFGAHSVVARTTGGSPDTFWQMAAEAAVADAGGNLYAGLVALPGAEVIRDLQGSR